MHAVMAKKRLNNIPTKTTCKGYAIQKLFMNMNKKAHS